jgi:KDO2-lipid IV(A) lauroyltransferase
MAMHIAKSGIDLAAIYRPLNNIFLNPIMERIRKKYICQKQIKKGISGTKDLLKLYKNGTSIALMIDQRVSEGEKINFFGKSALTTTLPAQLALKFNLSIIPVFIERDQNDNFKIKFYQEINPKSFNNKSNLTDKLNKVIEEMIVYRPEGWIWTHNRWK